MTVAAADTSIFPRNLDRAYPNIERGDGVWLYTTDGREILDGCSGGAMVTGLGHGRVELVDAATAHLGDVAYMYNHFFTSEPQERLAALLIEVAAPEMARVRLVSGGSEANETALRMARQYHVDRGDEARWQIISPAQSYHGSTMATLALSGRPALQAPYGPYLSQHLHIPPATPRFDPTGQAALDALDQALETAGPENVSAFYCEPVSAAALPAYSPPDLFWEGLAERRERYGFLVCFDEIVSGIGRTGRWMAYQGLPIEPDIVTIGNGLGAGYAPLAAMLCREPVYRALAVGSKYFDLGHTWDGAALPCSFGLAVLDYMVQHDVVARVAARGPGLRERIEEATRDNEIIGTVRGRGFLLGVEYVDPRDGTSILPADLNVGALIDSTSLEHGLLVLSTHPNVDGYAGDQTVIAPAFTSTDEELEEMIDRFGAVAAATEKTVKENIERKRGGMTGGSDGGYVLLGMPDMHGAIRGKALRPSSFEAAVENGAVMTDLWLGLDPVDLPITDYPDYGINAGAPDLLLEPDTSTRHSLSWRPGWEICLANPSWPDGSRCTLASREVLRDVLDRAGSMGYEVLSAFEYEVRITDGEGRPPSSGLSYSLTEIGRFGRLLEELPDALDGLGIELEAVHTEAGPGLLELNIAAGRGLRSADNAAFVKLAMKDLAASLGLTASFLAKTRPLEEGSSGHVHLSLWRDGENAFAPEEPGGDVPPAAAAAIGGILDHLPAASLLVNPTINSYKRVVPGHFAPVNVSWGYENRSASIRAIRGTRPARSRLECRRPGADANPYLALAGLVASALLGIDAGTDPPPPQVGDVSERSDIPALPNSLESALKAFRADGELRAALGEDFSDYFAVSREWELKEWQRSVSDWERDRYTRTV